MNEPLLARCRKVTGNANAAALLYRIAYWMPKARIVHNGKKWVANSRRTWCDQTSLSLDQYRRAIARLRQLALVETEQHLFAGRNVTHIRLTSRGQRVIDGNPLEEANSALAEESIPAPANKGTAAQLHIQGDTYTEKRHGVTIQAFAFAHANSFDFKKAVLPGKRKTKTVKTEFTSVPKQEKCSSSIDNGMEPDGENAVLASPPGGTMHASPPMKVAEAGSELEDVPCGTHANTQSASSPAGKPRMHPETPAVLEKVWRDVFAEIDGDYWIPPFTKKQHALLKQFVTACPPGKASLILGLCMRQWSHFTNVAKQDAGAFGLPGLPTPDFLVKYVTTAVNFGLQEMKRQKENAAGDGQQKKIMTAAPPSTAHVASEPKMTKEEFLTILNEEEDPE